VIIVNDGQRPPGYPNGYPPGAQQQPWAAQGPTQPWGSPPQQPGYGAPQAPAAPYAPYGAPQGYGAPQQPYGAPPPQNPYGPPPAAQNPYAAPYAQPGMPMVQDASMFGDSAGEHLRMTRGRYRASVYVFFAFLMQIGVVTGVFVAIAALIAGLGQLDDDATGIVTLVAGSIGFCGGGALAYFVFRDRWKCIEAFSSRFCSGLMNLSLLYVPWVALVYANVRGVQKLSGR